MPKKTTEVYPSPGEENRKLHQRADEFLEKEQKREETLKEAEDEQTAAEGENPAAGVAPASDESEKGIDKEQAAENNKSDDQPEREEVKAVEKAVEKTASQPASHRKWMALTMTLVAALVFVLGMYLGSVLKDDPDSETKQITKRENPVTEEIKDDLSLHNVVQKDEVYDVSFEVSQVKRRVDGLYVTFKVTNDGQKTVYFMANTMKMIGDDGKVYLPELGQGEVPSSFTGGGIAAGTAEEAILVFSVPKDVEPASFILENVTNLKNGSWTFQVDFN